MRRLCLIACLLLGACDDSTFDNPCDPQNAAAGQCPADAIIDRAVEPDQRVVDMRPQDAAPDMAADAAPDMPPDTAPDAAPDMAPAPDMTAPDMAAPDMSPDMTPPDMGPPAPTDSVCRMGENSADCIARDCNVEGCEPGPVCDSESGACLPPGPGDCMLQGCLRNAYCGSSGHCIPRCEVAGCPAGKRCDYNTSRCVPPGNACQVHGFDIDCVNANNEGECTKLGGQWGVWVDLGDNQCKCPAPDAGCPCRSHEDCSGIGSCMVPADAERVCRIGTLARCAPSNFPEVCQCGGRFPTGAVTEEVATQACPP